MDRRELGYEEVDACSQTDSATWTNEAVSILSSDPFLLLLTGYNGATFTYNAQNQLISATNGGNSAQFVYDGRGRWGKGTNNGVTRFIPYDEWNAIWEWDAA